MWILFKVLEFISAASILINILSDFYILILGMIHLLTGKDISLEFDYAFITCVLSFIVFVLLRTAFNI